MSLECVPLYDTLGETAIEYVMTHSETKFVCAAGSKLAGLAKALSKFSGQLVGVAYWGEAPKEAVEVRSEDSVPVLLDLLLLLVSCLVPQLVVPLIVLYFS